MTVIDLPPRGHVAPSRSSLLSAAIWPPRIGHRSQTIAICGCTSFSRGNSSTFGRTRSAKRAASSRTLSWSGTAADGRFLSAAHHRDQIQCPAASLHGLRRRRLQRADRGGGSHTVAPGISRGVGGRFGAIARLRRHRLEEDRKRRRRRHQPAHPSRLHALWRQRPCDRAYWLRDRNRYTALGRAAAAQAAKLRQGAGQIGEPRFIVNPDGSEQHS